MNTEPTKGVIYAAPGPQFVKEALVSAQSVKEHHPDLPTTLFTDCTVVSPYIDNTVRIQPVEMRFMDKILSLTRTPYTYTLFLDCDTYICGNISGIFSLLDQFDVAVAHAPFRVSPPNYRALKTFIDALPTSFPQFNTGVLLYRQSPAVSALWQAFASVHQRDWEYAQKNGYGIVDDQPAFREILYKSQLRFATLPPEYNCRFYMTATPRTTGFLGDSVKILHGRAPDLASVSCILNSLPGPRIHMFHRGIMRLYAGSGRKKAQRLWWEIPIIFHQIHRFFQLLHTVGITETLRRFGAKLTKRDPDSIL
jgi:hypothetical protein